MKIAYFGTHGTGKTVLVHETFAELKKKSLDVGIVEEVARSCPLPINENTTREAQTWILFRQYCEEVEAENRSKIVVCDRSVLDNYVYYVDKFGRNKALEPFIAQHMKTYDFLFRVPINEAYLTEDGKRSINKPFQRRIDSEIDELLKIFDIPFCRYTDLRTTVETILKNAEQKGVLAS
jgi:nicotinamide riboside kinase